MLASRYKIGAISSDKQIKIHALDKELIQYIRFFSKLIEEKIQNNESMGVITKSIFDTYLIPKELNEALKYENYIYHILNKTAYIDLLKNSHDDYISTYEFLLNYFFSALENMERMVGESKIPLTSLNIHKILLASFRVTNKFHFDRFLNNEAFALIAGVSKKALDLLEKEFLRLIGYKLVFKKEDISMYIDNLKLIKKDWEGWMGISEENEIKPQPDVEKIESIPSKLESTPSQMPVVKEESNVRYDADGDEIQPFSFAPYEAGSARATPPPRVPIKKKKEEDKNNPIEEKKEKGGKNIGPCISPVSKNFSFLAVTSSSGEERPSPISHLKRSTPSFYTSPPSSPFSYSSPSGPSYTNEKDLLGSERNKRPVSKKITRSG